MILLPTIPTFPPFPSVLSRLSRNGRTVGQIPVALLCTLFYFVITERDFPSFTLFWKLLEWFVLEQSQLIFISAEHLLEA